MPVLFLIDNEGPAAPGRDVRRGLKNNEQWVNTFLDKNKDGILTDEEIASNSLHGGAIGDDAYWDERDASIFASKLPCPYLRIQCDVDHVQGTHKYHMMDIINAATSGSGQWTRCNDNPPNIIYKESELSNYHFHPGPPIEHLPEHNDILIGYIKEMFFEQPWDKEE